jgi:hypothetical protein
MGRDPLGGTRHDSPSYCHNSDDFPLYTGGGDKVAQVYKNSHRLRHIPLKEYYGIWDLPQALQMLSKHHIPVPSSKGVPGWFTRGESDLGADTGLDPHTVRIPKCTSESLTDPWLKTSLNNGFCW